MNGWWPRLNRTQKLVFVAATLAWLFDCFDQQIFNLSRSPAIKQLVAGGMDPKLCAGWATACLVFGWATGGMFFGSFGDKFGRAKILTICVTMFGLAMGLTSLARTFWDFLAYLFITGLGVGGVFGLSVALVADSLPNDIRPRALGMLQSCSALGNVTAGLLGLGVAMAALSGSYWKWLFVLGAFPALATAALLSKQKEPQAWIDAKAKAQSQGKKAGSYRDLFGHPTWRRHALLGMVLSCAGVVGLWGIGVFSTDFVRDVVESVTRAKGVTDAAEISKQQGIWGGINLTCFNVGAFIGMMLFTRVTEKLGRRKAFAIFFTGSLIVTIFVFQSLKSTTDILWMAPLMGFFHLSVFAGFSIYLPELFPTRLRSTGTSFCYNVGRYLAATGPLTLGALAANLTKAAQTKAMAAHPDVAGAALDALKMTAKIDSFRNAASIMCVIFVLGLIVLPFLPETKGKPLPEEA